MTYWYTKYLSVFEKPFSSVPIEIIEEVRTKLQRLNSKEPLASIVVIAHNEEMRLMSCLWSLSEMICKYPVEIIGVNNNSIDRTEEVFRSVGIEPYFEEKKSCGYARRCGLEYATGKYYICIDSDTMYPSRYVETMIKHLEKPGVVGVSSLWSFVPNKNHSRWGLLLYESIRDIYIRAIFIKRPERGVRGMVFAYEAEYGRKVGYRVELVRGEDGSMAMGLKKYGRIKLVTSRIARAITANNTLVADGSLLNSFKVRAFRAFRNVHYIFIRQTKPPKDDPSNLIE